jgi:glycosyltransferase involved in cell wall biosynthesis
MRVGLRLFYNPGWMGGVNYVLNWARALRSLPASERPHVTLLTAAPAAHAIAQQHADLGDAISPFQETASLGLDFVYPATQLAEAPFGAPWAGWIPDWQCRHMPEMFSAREAARRMLQYRLLARHAPVCVVSSRMAEVDTAQLLPEAAAPRRVLHFPAVFADEVYQRSADRIAATQARLGAPERYLIICNQFWRHKNHLVVLEALKRVRRDDVHVVMSGVVADERWPAYADKVRDLLAHPDVARRATLLGSIDRDDQIDLMRRSLGVLQPSRFEGWSTVVEEARALGLPSLLSEFAVHREQNPPGGSFFDPNDADALADRLDDWFAAPPEKQSPEAAHARQAGYIQECARAFLAVAAEAKRLYDPARHDPKPITAAALLELKADLAEGRIQPEDEALFQANARALFREHPEELARLGGYVGDEAYPLYPESMSTMIVASLAKMAPDARARFFEADLEGEQGAHFAGKRDALASPAGRISLGAIAAAAKTRDFVRRKLNR